MKLFAIMRNIACFLIGIKIVTFEAHHRDFLATNDTL